MRLIRSLLFAPANRHELLKKLPSCRADAVAIDLEDGTPETEKASARDRLPDIVAYLRERQLQAMLWVRTNGPRSHHVKADMEVALETPIDGIIVPKLETEADLEIFRPRTRVVGIVETARGIVNVEALADQLRGELTALAFGAEDFVTDLGGRRTSEGVEVLYARSRVILAARLSGLQALDQVFTNIRDDAGFRRDAEFGRQLGYSGKMCITPRQTAIANEVFSPSGAEIDRCRRLIRAYEQAEIDGRGVIEFEGNMVDQPLLERARATLRLAEESLEGDQAMNASGRTSKTQQGDLS